MKIKIQLLEAIEEANEIASKLQEKKLKNDLRSKLAAACFAVSQQHYNSILLLLSRNPPLQATAFALFRPLVESCIRGLWLSHVASDAEVDEYLSSGTKLDMASMLRKLDSALGLSSHQSIYKNWSALSAYTHTGELQVQRWLKTNDIEPNYTESEVSELIKVSGLIAGLAYRAVLAISLEP